MPSPNTGQSNTSQSLPGFDFTIANVSVLTEDDCNAVAGCLGRLMDKWIGPRLHMRLADQHTIAITISGPLTVAEFQMIHEKVEQEAARIEGDRLKAHI